MVQASCLALSRNKIETSTQNLLNNLLGSEICIRHLAGNSGNLLPIHFQLKVRQRFYGCSLNKARERERSDSRPLIDLKRLWQCRLAALLSNHPPALPLARDSLLLARARCSPLTCLRHKVKGSCSCSSISGGLIGQKEIKEAARKGGCQKAALRAGRLVL